jgi:hypothetical protein
MDVKRRKPQPLEEFLKKFIEEHKMAIGNRVQLMVTERECMELGRFFLRGIVGWALAYDEVERHPYANSPLAEIEVDNCPEEASDEIDDDEASGLVTVIH